MAYTLQREGSFAGFRVEAGQATLASNTVEVPTKMTKILAASVSYNEAPAAGSQLYCDRTITNGAVTIADAAVAAKVVNYVFFGQ